MIFVAISCVIFSYDFINYGARSNYGDKSTKH